MSASRRAHVGKTTAERATYRQNVIRPKDRESLIPLPEVDSTDSLARVPEPSNRPLTPPRHSRPKKSGLRVWLEEHWTELFFGGFLLWLGYQVVGLNREMGETKTRLDAVEKTTADSSSEQRLQHQIDRLEDRINAAAGHTPQPMPPPTTLAASPHPAAP